MGNEADIVQKVLAKTNSELIVFFVLVVIVLTVVVMPLYSMISRDRKERTTHEHARQDTLLEVISANSDVMAGLKTALETTSASTNSTIGRIHERIDRQNDNQAKQDLALARIQATLDAMLRQQSSDHPYDKGV